jgi:hypothetical protein
MPARSAAHLSDRRSGFRAAVVSLPDGPESASRAKATSRALWKRSSGSFSRQRLITRSSPGGTTASELTISGGSWSRIAAADLHGAVHRLARGKRAALQPAAERLALETLEDHVRHSSFAPDIEDSEDLRVIQGGDGTGLLLETAQSLGIAGLIRGQDLEGDVAPEPRIAGPENLAHPPCVDRSKDAIRTEAHAGRERHGDLHGCWSMVLLAQGLGKLAKRLGSVLDFD